jgi:hypothetical protein
MTDLPWQSRSRCLTSNQKKTGELKSDCTIAPLIKNEIIVTLPSIENESTANNDSLVQKRASQESPQHIS